MPAAVPDFSVGPVVQAWLSTWDKPRAGIASLRSDVWAMPLRKDIIHRVFEWQRACERQGTSKTKNRAEKHGGGRKPRPQKGTGRSRQGSIRSPLWRGGGNTFPKRNRDFSYKLDRKVVTLGIKTALSDKYRRGALVVMRDFDLESDEPEELRSKLEGLGVNTQKQRVLFISTGGGVSSKTIPKGTPWRGRRAAAHRRVLAMHAKIRELRAAAATGDEDETVPAPPDHLLAAAEATRQLTVLTPEKTTVMHLIKHHTVLVSLDALNELDDMFANERSAGFVSALDDTAAAALKQPLTVEMPQQGSSAEQASA